MSKVFQVTILGVNSALPVHGRHPTCQIVHYDGDLYMIDCGEGSQVQLTTYKIKRSKLSHIFISHLHGDHCYGLPGLLTSFALGGRHAPLTLHGPIGIKRYIDTVLEVSGSHLPYALVIHEYDHETENKIVLSESLSVHTFPLQHRMPTMGFRWQEHLTTYNIRKEAISQYDLSIDDIKHIKSGGDLMRDTGKISNAELAHPHDIPRAYTYCSDTVYDRGLIPHITGSSLLYHETTYLDGLEDIARERMHTTLGQAISLAQSSGINRLITGHYSSRYIDPQIFYDEGIERFPGLLLGLEGSTYAV